MKLIIKIVLLSCFLFGQSHTALPEVQEVIAENNEQIENMQKELSVENTNEKKWFDRYVTKFFITDSKFRTAFRCMLPLLVGYFNIILTKSIIREITVLYDNQESFVIDDTLSLIWNSLTLLGANAVFEDLYFSAINVESTKPVESMPSCLSTQVDQLRCY